MLVFRANNLTTNTMPSPHHRRHFLKTSALGAALAPLTSVTTKSAGISAGCLARRRSPGPPRAEKRTLCPASDHRPARTATIGG